MTDALDNKLVIAISSRALFDLDDANRVFEQLGLDDYRQHQIAREDEPLPPGTAFPLARALLAINQRGQGNLVEVVLVSRNDADTGLRVMNSVETHGLGIVRAGFTDGRPPYEYLKPFQCDLFLSANEHDVCSALAQGFAAALVYSPPAAPARTLASSATATETRTLASSATENRTLGSSATESQALASSAMAAEEEVRIAFDGDAVLFSPAAEQVYRSHGLAEFHRREKEAAHIPLEAGPFKGFLEALHNIQTRFPEKQCPIRTALVTARSAPAHKRAVMTLRHWRIRIDEAFFLGGSSKAGVLEVFRPHIFFDDQTFYCDPAAAKTPTARVPPPG